LQGLHDLRAIELEQGFIQNACNRVENLDHVHVVCELLGSFEGHSGRLDVLKDLLIRVKPLKRRLGV
jgi:hypothetical protein